MKLIKEEKNILTEDTLHQCRNDAHSICRYIDKNGMSVWYDLIDYDMYPMNTSKVSFEVRGDWKHDHARFKNLVYDWAEENDRDIFKIDSTELDDGDSDNYTARYDVFITADKDSFDRLNSMRGLFREGLNAREKQIYIDSVNEAEDIDDLKEIVHEIYWYDKALFVKINKFPPDRDFEEIKANILKNLGAVDESLTEDRSLAKPFKKELKNAYKSFDASRDSVRKKNDAVVKTWNQAADGIPMDDNAKKILLKPEPKFSRFKPERSNSLEREEYPFYVTYYEETPYYHPEEGGYYVAGRQAIMSKGFDNKEDALKFAKEAADKFGFERIDDTWYHLGSRYIGEDDSVRVETKREYLSREEGDSVYESLAEGLSIEAKRNALDRINTEGGYAAYDLEDAAMKYQPDAKDLNDLTDDTVEKVYTDLKNDFINKLKVYGDDADLDGVLYDVFGVSESLKESLGADIDKLEQQISDMEVGDSVIVKNYKNGDTYEFVKRNDSNQISAFENIRGKNHMASPMQVFGWAKDSLIYAHFSPQFLSSDLTEDTIKTKDGKWTNKGKEGTHGKFKTKKEADAQRKAMFANGFHEDYDEVTYLKNRLKEINRAVELGEDPERVSWEKERIFNRLQALGVDNWYDESLKEDFDDNLTKLLNDYFRHHLAGNQIWADIDNVENIGTDTYKVDVRFTEEFVYEVRDEDGVPYKDFEDTETYYTYIVKINNGKVISVTRSFDESVKPAKKLKEEFSSVDLMNYNDFLANNFDGWSDDIDYLIKDLNKCARVLKTSANKLIFYVDYDEDFYAIDDVAEVVSYVNDDYSIYRMNDSQIPFICCVDSAVSYWIFKNEQQATKVVNAIKAYTGSLNEDFKLEGLVDITDDFRIARENWSRIVPDIDFDLALERWNAESKEADPDWFAKPIYSVAAWEDMVQMFSDNDIPEIEDEPEEGPEEDDNLESPDESEDNTESEEQEDSDQE